MCFIYPIRDLTDMARASEPFDPMVEDDLALERLGYKQGMLLCPCPVLTISLQFGRTETKLQLSQHAGF